MHATLAQCMPPFSIEGQRIVPTTTYVCLAVVAHILTHEAMTLADVPSPPNAGGPDPPHADVHGLPPAGDHAPQTNGLDLPDTPLLPRANRIFDRAQVENPSLLARSAWAATNTTSANATRQPSGTGAPQHRNMSRRTFSSAAPTPIFALTGREKNAASRGDTTGAIVALGVETLSMAPRHVLERRKSKALTPYNPDVWEAHLRDANLLSLYHWIPDGLRHGFVLNLPQIQRTQTPPNKDSILIYQEHVDTIIKAEFSKGRYIGPFSATELENTIGPFQSSPLSIIPKATPGKFRLLQNYSFPHNPTSIFPNNSINSFTNSDDFPSTWGTFTLISLLINRLPPGSQLATRDVAEAYRTIPLHHSQWPAAVVRIGEDSFAADTSTCFGVSPSSGAYGVVRDAGNDIMRSKGIGPISAWVDDHVFVRILRVHLEKYNSHREHWRREVTRQGQQQTGGRLWYGGSVLSDGTLEEFDETFQFACADLSQQSTRSAEDSLYSYNFDDINAISDPLGIPWERSKDRAFGFSTTYIGFDWDLTTSTVSLTPAKQEKYLIAIQNWLHRPKHTLEDVQKLYGKLLHTCSVIPRGRAYLTNLETMLSTGFSCPFIPHSAPKGTPADLKWWSSILHQPLVSTTIPRPVQLHDVGAYSDASSGFGIGIIVDGRWRAWRLTPGWQTLGGGKRDIAWAEAVGFECLALFLSHQEPIHRHFTIYGDNIGVVEGWKNGRSRNTYVNEVFKRIHELSLTVPAHGFHTAYVPTKSNPADGPSRAIYPPTHLLLPPITLPEALEPFLVDSQLPLTPTEVRLRRETHQI